MEYEVMPWLNQCLVVATEWKKSRDIYLKEYGVVPREQVSMINYTIHLTDKHFFIVKWLDGRCLIREIQICG